MGLIYSLLSNFGNKERNHRILMLGIDAAGKTTLLYHMKLGEPVTTIPTIGFNVETIQLASNAVLTIWDVSGGCPALWKYYLESTDALIYVVDASDRDRLEETTQHMMNLLANEALKNIVLLVLANKADLNDAISSSQLANEMGLYSLDIKWHIQSTVATTGQGISQGLEWLNNILQKLPSHIY
ncbi:hypothetical protein DFA_04689 [Cavenderia fasciculata]|uniref:Uncharacterized protein n=1 Tax=Cavenderia fasciculata TaxID=261658 RepID=F4PQ96_CACFS|nr:uncharacterized protein DFA_04689 [Cavenderia fasciculata]EGG22559.1 hypothetical protein DFA_04689 [Cavenderia fasciculata]|eukprot:XP_004360410.1 hypothetical protein DFA_04689 [Cavenderia fasciculata]